MSKYHQEGQPFDIEWLDRLAQGAVKCGEDNADEMVALVHEIKRLRACIEGVATAYTEDGDIYMSNCVIAARDGVTPPMMNEQQMRRVFPEAYR